MTVYDDSVLDDCIWWQCIRWLFKNVFDLRWVEYKAERIEILDESVNDNKNTSNKGLLWDVTKMKQLKP